MGMAATRQPRRRSARCLAAARPGAALRAKLRGGDQPLCTNTSRAMQQSCSVKALLVLVLSPPLAASPLLLVSLGRPLLVVLLPPPPPLLLLLLLLAVLGRLLNQLLL